MIYEEAVAITTEESHYNDLDGLSKARLFLGGHYARLNGELADILIVKPEAWQTIRYGGDVKSDTAAEHLWNGTVAGKQEIRLRKRLKAIEMMMTGLNTRISVLKGEAFSQL